MKMPISYTAAKDAIAESTCLKFKSRNVYWGSDWAAENFVRWAHTLEFIVYDAVADTFSLSPLGQQYIQTPATDGVNNVLEEALLRYPPIVRVLRLLVKDQHLTKFEIGRQLGFVGENGFTSLPQELLVRDLCLEPSKSIRSKMLSDADGTSDKYARMIAGWLEQIGWIQIIPKRVTVAVAGQNFTYTIPQAYTVTASGQAALRRAEGKSRHPRTPKNVYFENAGNQGTLPKLPANAPRSHFADA